MKKQQLQQLVDQFPDSVDMDEFLDRLYLLRKLEAAERDIARGDVFTHEEIVKELDQWER